MTVYVSFAGKCVDNASTMEGKKRCSNNRSGWFRRLVCWCREHLPDNVFLFVLAVAVGALTGFGAFIFKTSIRWLSLALTSGLEMYRPGWILLLLPVAGIMLTGIYVRYVLRQDISHGTAHLLHDLSQKMYRLKRRLTYAPMLASTITLGFGGSAGAEGPIAYTGAAIGSNVGQAFGLSSRMLMIMIGCGAGAGIAGIFKAPIGGVMFTLEVLSIPMTTLSVLALIVSSLPSWMVVYSCMGFTMDLHYAASGTFAAGELPMVLLLGLFCGLYSFYYSKVMAMMTGVYGRMRNPWLRNLLAGSLLAVLIFLFPSLYGEGYDSITKILGGNVGSIMDYGLFYGFADDWRAVALVAAGVLLAKCFACSATNSGGGVAGDFAPTLFAGCMAGLLFATVGNHVFGFGIAVSDFAYIAMAGVMAGAIRAPLMAIFITVEMTGCFSLFFPLVVCAVVSYVVVRALDRKDFYLFRGSHRHRRLNMDDAKKM